MDNKEAIQYLEWLSDIDFTKEYPKYPIVTKQEQVVALQMAIVALQELDKNPAKPNNPNDEVNNSTNNSTNEIKNRVKGMTACRVPEVDTVCWKKVEYKLTALVNEIEEIFSHIRERNEDDSVCGLCEYDGAYIGQSGDWCSECPGFDKSDCFKLKDKYRKEWVDIDG